MAYVKRVLTANSSALLTVTVYEVKLTKEYWGFFNKMKIKRFIRRIQIMILLLSIVKALPAYADINSDFLKAAEKGDIFGVKAMLEDEADINTADANGMTALMYTAKNGHKDIVNILIKRGVDLNKKNSNGETAIML